MAFGPEVFVQHLALIEIEMFRRVSVGELLSCGWTLKACREICPDIMRLVEWFQKVHFNI